MFFQYINWLHFDIWTPKAFKMYLIFNLIFSLLIFPPFLTKSAPFIFKNFFQSFMAKKLAHRES